MTSDRSLPTPTHVKDSFMTFIARLSGCLATLAIAAVIASPNAHAAVTIDIEQQGDDVVATYSGSWDTFTRFISTSSTSNYVSGNGNFQALQGPGEKDYMSTDPMALTFGTWTDIFTTASSSSGDPFGFNLGGDYFAPLGYTAGQSLSGSLTFANTDLVTMGFTPDSIGVFSGAGNTVTFSVSAVPEPATVGMLTVGCVAAGLGFVRRRR